MATANFYLKNPNGSSDSLVYFFFHYNGNKVKFSTGEKINPKHWVTKDQRARKSFRGYASFNDTLSVIAENAQAILRQGSQAGHIPTPIELRNQLKDSLDLTITKKITFREAFHEFLRSMGKVKSV